MGMADKAFKIRRASGPGRVGSRVGDPVVVITFLLLISCIRGALCLYV